LKFVCCEIEIVCNFVYVGHCSVFLKGRRDEDFYDIVVGGDVV